MLLKGCLRKCRTAVWLCAGLPAALVMQCIGDYIICVSLLVMPACGVAAVRRGSETGLLQATRRMGLLGAALELYLYKSDPTVCYNES